MRRDPLPVSVPVELRQAEELLERYGKWAQDRYKKQRCGSAEGDYKPPAVYSRDDEPMEPFIADWHAMQVQGTLQAVPMQWRRVLLAYYIPQRTPWQAMRRMMGSKTWHESHVSGVRDFWRIYSLRYLKQRDMIAPITRD